MSRSAPAPREDLRRSAPRRLPSRRRISPEGLLLPVFVLPVLLAAAALAYARGVHHAGTDRHRSEGPAAATRWLDGDPRSAAWVVSRFDEEVARTVAETEGWAPFRRGTLGGFVRAPGAHAGEPPWIVAEDFPSGLRPAALADPAIRLAVESGVPIARSPGADAATAVFADLVAAPTREAFRSSALPAGTKLHLLARLERSASAASVVASGDRVVLAALRDLDALIATTPAAGPGDPPAGRPLRPGCHAAGGTRILVPSTGAPLLLLPIAEDVPALAPVAAGDDPEGLARLLWTPTGATADDDGSDVLWRGRLDRPLAGEWSIVVPPGRTWWNSGAAATWAVPLAAGSLAFLAVPAALLVALRRRRKLDEARSRFVNEIAHDLRTPVAALRLHADLLASGRVAEEDRAKHAEILGREAARLTALLSNLLDLSRVERGTRPFEREDVDVAEAVREAVREFAVLHPRRAADVRVEGPETLVVVADRTALARALSNLLDNAGKFTPEGTAIRVSAGPDERGGVRIRVQDEGPGVPAEERTRVFLPYERGSAAARTAAPGTGLGLSLVRDLVEGMGGAVALADSPRGATFEVRLPGGDDARDAR